MDAFFNGLDCRLRVSGMLADSIMMGIVNSAMEDAYKKSCSKEGDVERLNEKSRFCELAIMQLEWCLKYLQEEMGTNIAESTHDREKLLSDLLETRDRIHNRLEETELAIAEKDRELMERKESLSELTLALEVRDDDITSLHSALQLERVKGERVNEFVPWNKKRMKNNGDLTFHELKNTIDQLVRKIGGKLADGRRNLTILKLNASSACTRKLGSDLDVDDDETSCDRKPMAEDLQSDGWETIHERFDKHRASESDLLMVQMETEIEEIATNVDILKEKIDSSFVKMESSISLLKSLLDERQWVWNVEEGIVNVIIRSFLRDMQHEFNVSSLMLDMNWSALMDDITSLHNELEMLATQKDVQPKTDGGMEKRTHHYLSSRSIVEDNNSQKTASLRYKNEMYDSARASRRGLEDFSDASSKDGRVSNTEGLSKENPSGHSVADMIRNHESIIWKKTQEINRLKEELLSEKDFSNIRNDKNLDSVKEMIARVIARLDDVIKKKAKSVAACDNHRRAYETGKTFVQNDLSGSSFVEEDQTPIMIHGQSGKNLCCRLTSTELCEEIRLLKQETEDLDIKATILEETNAILFKGLIRRLRHESIDYDLGTLIREDTYRVTFGETAKEWNNQRVIYSIKRLLMEDIYRIVLTEVVKDIKNAVHSTSVRRQEENLPFGGNLMDDTYRILFSEMVKEWDNERETCNIERFLMEDISHIVFAEVVKDIENTVHSTSMRGQEEDVSLANNACENYVISERIDQTQEMDSLSSQFDAAGDLEFSYNSELMDPHSHLDLVGCDLEKSNEQYIEHGQLLVEKDDAFKLVTGKFEKALQQIVFSKMQFRESTSSLQLSLSEREVPQGLVTSTSSVTEDGTPSLYLPTSYEQRCWTELQSMPMHLTKFSQAIVDFEHMACGKIIANVSRFEDLNHQLNSLVVEVKSIKKKELLYRKAFTRRCYDLQTAEAEVDLLGDQVDQLLGLVEKIYVAVDHYSPVLQHYFGVMDILRMMREELQGGATSTFSQ